MKELANYTNLKALNLKYCSELGIIDFFDGALKANQFIANLDKKYSQFNKEAILGAVEEVESYIESISNEKPCIIRFFTTPDFDSNLFNIVCVAKISNNGSTFIIANSKEYIETLGNPYSIEIIY